MNQRHVILFTIDVEDWFQVENLKPRISFSSWPSYELRVEKNTRKLLDLLDSINPTNPTSPKATFFILGWVAARLTGLVREIHDRGHEVASHGYFHNLCTLLSHKELKRDLSDSRKLLEDIIGSPVFGYRAPNFSIDDHILMIVSGCGYNYDSSFNSFGMNKRYGRLTLNENGKRGIAYQIFDDFYEIPISNKMIGNRIFPWGGGGYFRIIPLYIYKLGVRSILKKDKTYLFYMHPWEIDPEQPRVNSVSSLYSFRHYVNLSRTYPKISKLLESLSDCRFLTCKQYLELNKQRYKGTRKKERDTK